MNIKTLIIGFVPLTDTTGKKPRQIRDDTYFKEFLANYDLGEVHFAPFNHWKEVIKELDPLFVIMLGGGDYYAREVQEYKNDVLIYVSYDTGQIFYRKAEIEKKKEEQRKTFTEISRLVQQFREEGEKGIAGARHFATLSYDDMYKMFIKAIIGDDEDLKKKAWDLLMTNDGHPNLIWMRVQLICEAWDHSDGKGKEEFLCIAMNQHIDEGLARKLEDFIDEEGQQFHQYMFVNFFNQDMNYIRRIPFGFKGQDKYGYQAVLDKYETPNGPQMMLEAGQMKSEKEKYFKGETEKVAKILTAWKEDPTRSKKELKVAPWNASDSEDDPLTERELTGMKNFLKKHGPGNYEVLFNQ